MRCYYLNDKEIERWWLFDGKKISLLLFNGMGYFKTHDSHEESVIKILKGIKKITVEEFDKALSDSNKWFMHEKI